MHREDALKNYVLWDTMSAHQLLANNVLHHALIAQDLPQTALYAESSTM
jgi:hypothetical protein